MNRFAMTGIISFSILLIPIVEAKNSSVPVTECDELASVLQDEERVSKPVWHIKNQARAKKACEKALKKYPASLRIKFLNARVDALMEYERGDQSKSRRKMLELAESGYAAAQYFVADTVFVGKNIRNLTKKERFQYFKKSAKSGNSYGIMGVGLSYELGIGVNIKISKSMKWYRFAIDKGNTESMYRISGLLIKENKKESINEAIQLLKKSAYKNNVKSLTRLGSIYSKEKF